MTFALCFSGQTRSFLNCYESIRTNILDVCHPDIFIHTWERTGVNDSIESIKENKESLYSKTSVVNLEKLINLYQPKKIIVENFDFNIFKIKADRIRKKVEIADWYRLENGLAMYYSIMQSNQLKQIYEKMNGFIYDGVIRSRFDLLFSRPIDILKQKLDKIYLPPSTNEDWLHEFHPPNDQFAYSCSAGMDYYSSIFDLYEEYVDLRINYKYDFCITGEGTIDFHLNKSPFRKFAVGKADIGMKINRNHNFVDHRHYNSIP